MIDRNELILHFAKAIVANSNYAFSRTTKNMFMDPSDGTLKNIHEAIMIEAASLADAYLKKVNTKHE